MNKEISVSADIAAQGKNKVFGDRVRTNIFRAPEQKMILFLVQRVPSWLGPDHLTLFGAIGSVLVGAAFVLAAMLSPHFLLLVIPGLILNWVGDSLDGRLAYYRNTPRKWYGFALDIIVDWFSIVLTGIGYYVYSASPYRILALLFVSLYAWSMIISQLRYKIAGQYSIDSGLVGPTEFRVLIALIVLLEWLIPDTIHICATLLCAALLLININDTRHLLNQGNERDRQERNARN